MSISDCAELCVSCNIFDFCLKQVAANDNDDEGIVRLPTPDKVLMQSTLHRLSLSYNVLIPSTRRTLPKQVCEIVWPYSGVVVDSFGRSINHRNLDPDAILGADDDPSCSWSGAFYKFALKAPERNPKDHLLPRLELLFIALAIKHPNVARHITR